MKLSHTTELLLRSIDRLAAPAHSRVAGVAVVRRVASPVVTDLA
jgi:hypothetical protein